MSKENSEEKQNSKRRILFNKIPHILEIFQKIIIFAAFYRSKHL